MGLMEDIKKMKENAQNRPEIAKKQKEYKKLQKLMEKYRLVQVDENDWAMIQQINSDLSGQDLMTMATILSKPADQIIAGHLSAIVKQNWIIIRKLSEISQRLAVDSVDEEAPASYSREFQPADPNSPPDEYEQHCMELLRGLGWVTHTAKISNYKGVGIIAEKKRQKFFVKCKKSSVEIGDNAVKEVIDAMKLQDLNFAALVSNNTFIPTARTIADKSGILLLHHSQLNRLDELFNWCKP